MSLENGDRIDPAYFREVLGHYPTGVVVVTATDENGNPIGMTVGSFTSVSLDPPLIAFLPSKTSSTFPAVRGAGQFCVNILSARQEELCRAFAVRGSDRFASIEWSPSPISGSPVLDGIVAWIDCDLEAVFESGDHYIVIGRARGLAVDQPTIPLLFFQRGYGGFAATSLAMGATSDILVSLGYADHARPTMEAIAAELGVECRVLATAGDELLIVATAQASTAGKPPTQVGTYLPFLPPWGSFFVAWSSAEAVDTWMRRLGPAADSARRAAIEHGLASLHDRGWALTFRSARLAPMEDVLDAIARHGRTPVLQRELSRIVPELESPVEPEHVDESSPPIRSLSVPVFDESGAVVLQLVLLDLPHPIGESTFNRFLARLREGADEVATELRGSRAALTRGSR